MKPLSRSEIDALDHLAHMAKFGWYALTGRACRRRDMLRVVDRGLAESAGDVVVVDGDGYPLQPERYRVGFRLTDAGRVEVVRIEAERKAEMVRLMGEMGKEAVA